jgi:hypothetical protein
VNGSEAAAAAPEIECEEKARLTRLYIVASADYTRAVQVLNLRAGVMLKPEYDQLRAFVETARRTAEEARSALDGHTAAHGC